MSAIPVNASEWFAKSDAEKLATVRSVDVSQGDPEDHDEFEQAIATHARKLVEADDLESLIWDLYHTATALDRFLEGKPKGGDEGSLLMLNRRLRELRLAVDGECEG